MFRNPSEQATIPSPRMEASPTRRAVARWILALAGAYWIFSVVWFWRYCARNINADAVSYIGIARHIRDGSVLHCLHGYWSPLVSWLIAASSFMSSDLTLAARILMLALFAVSLTLVYCLTSKLWDSPLLSAFAVLWFTVARGISVFSVSFIGADLLLTSAVLLYFILLLACTKQPDSLSRWTYLGVTHAVAFLSKAIAMPLLAIPTVLAALWTLQGKPRRILLALSCAAAAPALVWTGWGLSLHARYGVFTSGYQLHWNLLPQEARAAQAHGKDLLVLTDTRKIYDAYMVSDTMPAGSPLWHTSVWHESTIRQILGKERENLPVAIKELLVLLTPGGILLFLCCLGWLTAHRTRYTLQFRFVWLTVVTTGALLGAYCMLVFDGRYVIPITPVLISLSVGFFAFTDDFESPALQRKTLRSLRFWQATLGVVLLAGLIGLQVYWASPFRRLHRDYQESVYRAAQILTHGSAASVVTIGEGPYPEHGVGWEAGMYAAYFSGTRVVGELNELPQPNELDSVVADINRLRPDAVMIWGTPADSAYTSLLDALRQREPITTRSSILDPARGDVGTVFVLK
jgi:4-amino-4-deoxy-L-arabinose transferase-like glycosyltransferase